MEQFFTSLSKRQTMLLLTSLAFGGSDAVAAYDHLPAEEEELLKHRAQSLLQIPRDKRVPLLVQEIKRLFTMRRRQLATADPKRMAEVLSKERPAMIEVMLRALPGDLATAVRAQLGPQPKVNLVREVKPEVLSIIRWRLEEALKQNAPQVGTFRFTDLMTLQQREIWAICDRMGARVLATAIAGLPDEARDEFVQRLPPDQRALAVKAAEAGKAKRLTENDAKLVLEMHDALENPSLGMRSAGAQRLARAAVAQAPEFAQRLVERHPGELGKLLGRWVRDEKGRPVKGDGGKLDIVEQMERLAKMGIIDRPIRLPPPVPPAAKGPNPFQPVPLPANRAVAPATTGSARNSGSQVAAAPRSGTQASAKVPAPERSQASARAPQAERPPSDAGGSRVLRIPEGLQDRPKPTGSGRPAATTAPPQARKQAGQGAPSRPPADGEGESTDPGMPRKVLRDGKPLQRGAGAPATVPTGSAGVRKASTMSPAVQAIPRKKERPETGRSPVLKGSSGRGPSGRSE